MALGATGKRKRNPFAAGLTGALAGGSLGMGAGALMSAYKNPGPPPAVGDATAKTTADAIAGRSTPEKFYALVKSRLGGNVPEAKGDTVAGIALEAAQRNIGNPTLIGGAAGGAAGLGIGDQVARHGARGERLRQFVTGADMELKATTTPSLDRANLEQFRDRVVAQRKPYGGLGLRERVRTMENARTATRRGNPVNPLFGRAMNAGEAAANSAKLKATKSLLPSMRPGARGTGSLVGTAAGLLAPTVYEQARNWWDSQKGGQP